MTAGLHERIEARVSPDAPPFRLRGGAPVRIEALRDAVLGFAITLAVVSLEVPGDSGQLLSLLRGFASFFVTFVMLFSVWYAHAQFCRRYGLDDTRTTWITGAILFVVVFYTYPLKFLMNWVLDSRFGLPGPVVENAHLLWIVSAYGAGLCLLSGLFWALHRHALALADLLELDAGEEEETRFTMRLWSGSAVVCVPLMITAALSAFPVGSPGRKPAAIVYLILLFGVTGWFYVRMFRLTRQRKRLAGQRRAGLEPGEGAR